MTSNPAILIKTLIMYGICLAIAVIVGYLLATPTEFESVFLLVLVLSLLLIPILLRWHHPWLIIAWNLPAMMFILPGRPTIGTLMIAVSMLISLLQHTLNRNFKFIHVREIALPLIFLTAVLLATARLRGGGLNVFGSSSIGGRRYLAVLLAIVGYFALTAHRIPRHRARLYVALFFVTGLVSAVTQLAGVLGPGLSFIYLIFPIDVEGIMALNPENAIPAPGGDDAVRMGGLAGAAASAMTVMLAYYGVAGFFEMRRPWRLVLFAAAWLGMLVGGYRSILIVTGLTFALVFWFEGLMRSRLLPVFVLTGALAAALVLPFASSMPYMIQRTLSFVPGIRVDPAVEMDVKASNDWRLDMWKTVLKEVPKYLVVGKGYAIDAAMFTMVNDNMAGGGEVGESSMMAGDYHNGPLSVIMPFGIFGVVGFLWFLWAGIKVLYRYYRDGDPALRRLNTLLLATFIAKALFFMTIIGSFYGDLIMFAGVLGLGVSINGPLPSPAREQHGQREAATSSSLAPAPAPAFARTAR